MRVKLAILFLAPVLLFSAAGLDITESESGCVLRAQWPA
jgi:hypothetical protein